MLFFGGRAMCSSAVVRRICLNFIILLIYLALAAQEHAACVVRPPWIWIRTLPKAPENALISPSRRAFPCNESFAPAGIPSARRNQV